MIAEDPLILRLHCAACGEPIARRADELGAPFCSVHCEAQHREAEKRTRSKLREASALFRMRLGLPKGDPLLGALDAIEYAYERVREAALSGFSGRANGR